MAPTPDADRLSEAENERIFQERIRPLVLPDGLQPAREPTFIMLGGQPGAGKTGLLIEVREILKERGAAVSVVGDDLRGFHPSYRTLQLADPENAALRTNPDAGRWVERLLEEARNRRISVVLETTMRQPDNVERIMRAFQEAGYRTEARVVAVSERESWQGVHLRYEATLAAGGSARFTVKAVHDAAAVGMLASLERIEDQGLADRTEVRRRTGETVYGNVRENGVWREPARAADAVLEERDRSSTPEDLRRHDQRWATVLGQMADRDAPVAAVAAVEGQAGADRRAMQDRQRLEAERESAAEITLIPAPQVASLSDAEIDRRLSQSTDLAQQRASIERSARIAYGEEATSLATTLTAQASLSPQAARALGTQVILEPHRFGTLLGRAASVFRGEDETRRSAKAELPRLAEAVEDYGASVARERRRIAEDHAREQSRQAQAVVVSRVLADTLAASPREQDRRLAVSEPLREELARLQISLQQRLSPGAQQDAGRGRTGRLSKALQISPTEAKAVAQVYRQVVDRQARPVMQEQRTQDRGRSLQRV